MRPATTLTIALLLIALFTATIVFLMQARSDQGPVLCSGAGGKPVACETTSTAAH